MNGEKLIHNIHCLGKANWGNLERKNAGEREMKRNAEETRDMREKCEIGEPSRGTNEIAKRPS